MHRKIRDLFFVFAKIGVFTFGSRYPMISVIESSCVDQRKWITHDEMMDVTVMAESTPGSIMLSAVSAVLGATVYTIFPG